MCHRDVVSYKIYKIILVLGLMPKWYQLIETNIR